MICAGYNKSGYRCSKKVKNMEDRYCRYHIKGNIKKCIKDNIENNIKKCIKDNIKDIIKENTEEKFKDNIKNIKTNKSYIKFSDIFVLICMLICTYINIKI